MNTNNQNQNQINDQMSIYSHQANITQQNYTQTQNPLIASPLPNVGLRMNQGVTSGNTRDTEKILVISDLIKNTNYSERNVGRYKSEIISVNKKIGKWKQVRAKEAGLTIENEEERGTIYRPFPRMF